MTLAAVLATGSRVQPRWVYAGAALALLGGVAVLFTYDPASSGRFPQCPFYASTGFHCPGCGTLRALHQLSNGNLMAAFGLNPLMVLSLPFVAYSFMSKIAREVRGCALPTVFVPSGWIWALFVLVISFWILRNIPVYPFSWLAP